MAQTAKHTPGPLARLNTWWQSGNQTDPTYAAGNAQFAGDVGFVLELNAELLTALKECQAVIRDYRLQIGTRIRLPNDTINHASYALKISDEAIAKAEGR